ncbi:ATP-binding protein [Microbacterium sp.]|uniref:ATP-binding protein n=1 Tax=Microbacterium sp. TaxID=51671 RepID=UPI0039E23DCE
MNKVRQAAAAASVTPRPRSELRGRITAVNQLLLCGIVASLFVFGLAAGTLSSPAQFGVGALLVVLGGIAALAVPWDRLRPGWVAVIPVADIVAIGILRTAESGSGLALLWAFPAMWLSSIGLFGFVLVCTLIPGLYWMLLAVFGQRTDAALLLPLAVIAIGWASFDATRRFTAQRDLLDSQAERLAAARAQAARQEQLVTEVLDTVDFGVVRISAHGDVVFENDAIGRLRRAMPGVRWDDPGAPVFAADGRTPLPADRHPLIRLRRGEVFDDVVVWYGAPPAQQVALTFTARRLAGHDGEPAGSVLVARDITAEREALRARDDLVASVSHELRTPLTSVLGYLELALEDDDLSERARRNVGTALRNSERLLVIVADILAASNSSRASMEATVRPRPTDVSTLLHAAVADLRLTAADRVVDVSVDAPPGVEAFADPARLRQVVDNLLGNAIKYNRDGGTVTVTARREGDATTIEVRDSGIGIRAADQERVFERFFRAAPDLPGNGLGLSISRDLVRAHGGTITVASEAGVGSVFTVMLPATAAAGGEGA